MAQLSPRDPAGDQDCISNRKVLDAVVKQPGPAPLLPLPPCSLGLQLLRQTERRMVLHSLHRYTHSFISFSYHVLFGRRKHLTLVELPSPTSSLDSSLAQFVHTAGGLKDTITIITARWGEGS